jgi:hypothetical protein
VTAIQNYINNLAIGGAGDQRDRRPDHECGFPNPG